MRHMSRCYWKCVIKILTHLRLQSWIYHSSLSVIIINNGCRIHELSVSIQCKINDHKPLPQRCGATSLDICSPYCCTLHVPTPSDTWSGSRDGRNKSVVDCPSLNTRHLHQNASRLSDQVGQSQTTAQLLLPETAKRAKLMLITTRNLNK